MTLLCLILAWTCGILLGHLLWSQGVIDCRTPVWQFGLTSGAAAVSLLLLRKRPAGRRAAGAALFLVLGVWRYDLHPLTACLTPTDLAYYNEPGARGVQVDVEGVISKYPEVRESTTNYVIAAESLAIGGQARPVQGLVLVQARRYPAYRYGDRLIVSGRLAEPPAFDDFDYRAYLARSGIYSLMRQPTTERIATDQGARFWSLIYGLRERGERLLDRVLPEPDAALANGMLLGIEGGIPDDLYEAYRMAGVAHIIVISGSNISLLAGVLAFLIARPFGRRRAVLPVILGVVLYVLLAGAQPPAVRAGAMAILFLIAVAIGRQSTAWIALAASALFMTALNPLTLWDASFQLSFMATLGLILFTPPMTAALEVRFERRAIEERTRRLLRLPAGLLIATVAAQLLVTPLMLFHFGRLSLISLPANLLVLPAQPPVMAGGLATLVGGLIWEPAGRVLALVPWIFLTYTNAVVRVAASVPLASIETGAPSGLLVLLFYGVLFGILTRGWISSARAAEAGNRTPAPFARAVGLAALVTVPLWVGLSLLNRVPDGRLHLLFDAGGGSETVFVITPGGTRLRIEERSRAVPSGPDGSPDTQDVRISPGLAEGTTAGTRTIDPAELPPGTRIKTADGVTLTRLAAGDGWTLGLTYGRFGTLLPSALSQESQAALLRESGPALTCSLLKAPNPTGGVWPSLEFLNAVAPQLILWPEDAHYAPGVEAWLAEHEVQRIAAESEVEVVSDGERMWLTKRGGTPVR